LYLFLHKGIIHPVKGAGVREDDALKETGRGKIGKNREATAQAGGINRKRK